MAWTGDRRTRPRNGARRLPEKLRRRVLNRYPTCWLNIPGICTVTSTEVHHVTPDAEGGTDAEFINGQPQLVGVCSRCHAYVSARDSAARAWNWRRQPEPHPGVLP